MGLRVAHPPSHPLALSLLALNASLAAQRSLLVAGPVTLTLPLTLTPQSLPALTVRGNLTLTHNASLVFAVTDAALASNNPSLQVDGCVQVTGSRLIIDLSTARNASAVVGAAQRRLSHVISAACRVGDFASVSVLVLAEP